MTARTLHPVLAAVTERITERSRADRAAYLRRLEESATRGPMRTKLACANLAHGFAAADPATKEGLRRPGKPNLAIVSR